MAKIHLLKIQDLHFNEVNCERKKAELRLNDRDYQIGDYIVFTNTDGEAFDSEKICRAQRRGLSFLFEPKETYLDFYEITHVLPIEQVIGGNKVKGWVMLSIRKVKK